MAKKIRNETQPIAAPDSRQGFPLNSRRKFLREGAVLGGATLLGGVIGTAGASELDKVKPARPGNENLPPNTPQWSQSLGAPVAAHPYGKPSEFEKNVIRRQIPGLTRTDHSSIDFAPLQDLHGIITPNGLHFERHHSGFPAIHPAEHRLIIHGLVKTPLIFSVDEIIRFPAESRIHFIECGANSGMEWSQPTQISVQFTHGMLSCCEWTGVLVSTLFEEVGVKPEAKWVLAEGADGAGTTRSIPIEKMLDDALVAYAQNGERLRPEQGYPLRLLLPGYQGITNIKWLRRLKVGDQPWHTREETSHYTDLLANGKARQFTVEQEAKSVITFPSGGQVLDHQGFYEISGIAWSGRGRIKAVDVSTDGGKNWKEAVLQEPVLHKCLTRFRLAWNWDGKPALLMSRAMDETGYVQPTMPQLVAIRGTRSIYHNNAIQTWRVDANGQVSNVHLRGDVEGQPNANIQPNIICV